MIPHKRKPSNPMSPPSPARRPRASPFSPPHNMTSTSPPHRPMTTAAAAAAALKRATMSSSSSNASRRQSSSTPAHTSSSRQGSVEADREGSTPKQHAAVGDETDEAAAAGNNPATAAADSQNPQDPEADDDDENKEDLLETDMDAQIQAQIEQAKEDMKILLENFSEDQLQRYEAYRRSALNRTNVRRLVSQVMNQQCSQTLAIVVAGFTKVYVGEIIEIAREVMEEWGQSGALRPDHLREAHRRYKLKKEKTADLGRKLFRR